MTSAEVVRIALTRLNTAGIPYMVVGSLASSFHGVPRTTQDADVVIVPSSEALTEFLQSMEQDFYVPRGAAAVALQKRGMFNVVHLETGFKLDFIVRKSRPYSEEEFRRRQEVLFGGGRCWFPSPEDALLAKLEWAKLTDSERHVQDAAGIVQVQRDRLDWGYLRLWGRELGVLDLLWRVEGPGGAPVVE
ncbi:MAG: DUF6036 family nucleotidyltransferase [Candidatus Bipolaricaulota bacterium]